MDEFTPETNDKQYAMAYCDESSGAGDRERRVNGQDGKGDGTLGNYYRRYRNEKGTEDERRFRPPRNISKYDQVEWACRILALQMAVAGNKNPTFTSDDVWQHIYKCWDYPWKLNQRQVAAIMARGGRRYLDVVEAQEGRPTRYRIKDGSEPPGELDLDSLRAFLQYS